MWGLLSASLPAYLGSFGQNVSHAYLWLIGRDSLRVRTSDTHVGLLPGVVKVDDISFFYAVFILCDYGGESNRQHPRLEAGIRRQEEASSRGLDLRTWSLILSSRMVRL